jgi:hypothetical protein
MALVLIRTNADGEAVQFRPDAAASFRRMEAQKGRRLDVNRTVVPYDVQMDLWEKRQRGEYPYTVAHPDYSDHVYRSDTDGGNAWDTDERGDWLEENGWIADVPGEPWHRRYVPGRDKRRNDPTPTNTNQSEEDNDMLALRIKDDNGTIHMATLGIGVFRHLIEDDDPERMMKIVRSDDQWTDVGISELPRLLTTYGCDTDIYRVEPNGQFVVRNTRDNVVRAGGMWHR